MSKNSKQSNLTPNQYKSAKVAFLGDVSLNDDYVEFYKNKKKPFNQITPLMNSFDYVVGNLECMAEGQDGENTLKVPRLKTTVNTLEYLKDINLNCALLAHNHIYDNLMDGYKKTTSYLRSNDIDFLGAGESIKDSEEPLIVELDGIKLCMLNYVTSDTNPSLPDNAEVYLNHFDKEKIIKDIKSNKDKVDHVVLLLHWGGRHEGAYYPDYDLPELGKIFIDNGADIIIGNHSHTWQPYEIYKEKYIFYSLGNFCFSDAYEFNYEINQARATKSVIVEVDFSKKDYTIHLHPIRNIKGYIKKDMSILKEHTKRQHIFSLINKHKLFWTLYHYQHKYLFPIYYYFFGNSRTFLTQFKRLELSKIKYYFFR